MAIAVGLKFDQDDFPEFYQIPTNLTLEPGDFCVVREPADGPERVGFVDSYEVRCQFQYERLRPILRIATDMEVEDWHRLGLRRREALTTARTKVIEHALPMKLIAANFNEEQNIVLFHFTADHRIDFRELVRDLAGVFKARIELWQIGSRQGAAEKDGYGHCGQRMCCATWMRTFPPISIRQARDQDINQSPPKLSGMCGRLRCCLRYEHENYCHLSKGATPVGALVRDGSGMEGHAVDRNLLTGKALVHYAKSKADWIPFDQLTVLDAGKGREKDHPVTVPATEEDEVVIEDDRE